MDGDSGSWIVSQRTHRLCGYVFAKVDEFELAYMLPIEPVLNDISGEFSKKTKCSVDVPDGATIRRLGDMMVDKYIEEVGQAPEPPSRSPPTLPALLPDRERPGGSDDSLEHLPTVNSSSLALDPPTALGAAANGVQFVDSRTQSIEKWRTSNQSASSASKATRPSSDHVQPVFSVQPEENAIDPAYPSAPAQEMQQIGSLFVSYLPFTPFLSRRDSTYPTSELPLPGHENSLYTPNSPSQEEAGPSSSSRRDNSDDLGPPQASRNPYRASMMTINPAPAQLPSSGHVGSLPPPSRKAPEIPQIESEFYPSRQYWLMIFKTSLLLVISLGLPSASGSLTYFIVRKRHFSTVAKVFSIFGALSISLSCFFIFFYIIFHKVYRRLTIGTVD